MSNVNYGVLTPVDMAMAYAYAVDQVNRLKCNDKELLDKLCGKDKKCLQWKKSESKRIWPMPDKISTHECAKVGPNSPDCITQMGTPDCQPVEGTGKNYCVYKPKDAQSGSCHIIEPNFCKSQSTVPYKCDDTTCKFLDKDQLKDKVYVEWNEFSGTCDTNKLCDASNKCTPPEICVNGLCKSYGGSTCPTGQTCLNGKCTCKTDDDCDGSSTCDKSSGTCNIGGRCILGNFLLKQWCEKPQSRCTKDYDGNYPSDCKGSNESPGVTDVPPFFYDDTSGQCYMTNNYCKRFGVDYNKKSCKTDNDCTKPEKCFTDPNDPGSGSYCTGPGSECEETSGQKAGEFFLGKTLFRMFKSDVKCEGYQPPVSTPASYQKKEMENKLKSIFKSFNNLPEICEKLADTKMMEKIDLVNKNFIPGIDLFLCKFKPESNVTPLIKIGFDAKQVQKVFPKLVIKKKGLLYIKISKKDINNDNRLKRIYLTLNSSQWMTTNLANKFLNTKYADNL